MSKQYANGISVKPLIGGDLEAALDAVADLRISVLSRLSLSLRRRSRL